MNTDKTAQSNSFQTRKNGRSGEWSIALGGILISFSAVFAHVAQVGPSASAFYRMAFGGLAMLFVCVLRREPLWAGYRALLFNALAGISLSIDMCFWHRSIEHLGPGLATILGNCQVFGLILVGALFYGEKFSNKFFLAMGLAVFGMYLMVADQWVSMGSDYQIGVFQGLMTAVFYSGYTAFLQKAQQLDRQLSPTANMLQLCTVASMMLLVISSVGGEVIAIPDWTNLFYLVAYGVLAQGLGWILISRGLATTSISIAGFLILLQPSLSFVWDITLFHRFTPGIEILGALITLGAIYLSTTCKLPKKSAASA